MNGVLYTAGGWNGCTPYSNLEAYDPINDTWTQRAKVDLDVYVRQRARELGLDEDEAVQIVRPHLRALA